MVIKPLQSSSEVKVGDSVYLVDKEALSNWPDLKNRPGIVTEIDKGRDSDSMTILNVDFGDVKRNCFYWRFGKSLACEVTGRPMVIGEL